MVTVSPGDKVLASHVNEKYVKAGDTVTGSILVSPNGGAAIGSATAGFSRLYLKDTTNSNVYKIEVIAGVLTTTLAP